MFCRRHFEVLKAMKKVVIIGGGIAGLATAYYLRKLTGGAVHTTIVERSQRLGGKIASTRVGDFLIEGGPDSFITQKPEALELCRELGLGADVIGSNSAHKTTYVVSSGELHPMPEGMMLMAPTMMLPFLRSRLISWMGKLRMGMEFFLPKRAGTSDESLASFVNRRLGTEALDKLAAPLIAGIFAADPEKLSLRSTFPMFLDIEAKHGSLLRGMLKRKKPAGPGTTPATQRPAGLPMFATLRGGLQELVEALVARLDTETILLNRQISEITENGDRYRIAFEDGSSLAADELVFATPADVTAELTRVLDGELAASLGRIRYVSTATVSLGFKRSEVAYPLDGFGFVVPHSEHRRITACSWSSTKFSNRAPDDSVLLRAFVGGDRAQELAEQSGDALLQLVREELAATMGITATPVCSRVYRWFKANPQYDVGHLDRVAEIEALTSRHQGLHLAGAAYRGAGIPGCIQSALKVATRIAEQYKVTLEERQYEPAIQ